MRTLLSLVVSVFVLAACSQIAETPPLDGAPLPTRVSPSPTPLPLDPQPTGETPAVTLPTPELGKTIVPPGAVPVAPFEPKPEDGMLERSTVHLDYIGLVIMESYPVQIGLELQGYLPTPCHSLRVSILPPDEENRIYGEVFTVVDPSAMCIQVIKEFESNVNLGNFPAGHYTVYINGELVGEFDT